MRLPVASVMAVLLTASCTGSAASTTNATVPSPGASSRPVVASGNFFAVLNGRAVEESPTQLQNDFGPGAAVAPAAHGAWVVRSTAPCRSTIQLFAPSPSTSFVPEGSVGDLAVSPDGRWLAYSRAGSTPDTRDEGGGCGPGSLVIRDLRTTAE